MVLKFKVGMGLAVKKMRSLMPVKKCPVDCDVAKARGRQTKKR